MRNEVQSAVEFLSNILKNQRHLTPQQVEQFQQCMLAVMNNHYHNHWFPEKPFKGSGYRCIRINHKMDPLISKAGDKCGLTHDVLFTVFPRELTLWVDPNEVSYRIGEDGSIGVLYEENEETTNSSSSSPESLSPAQSETDIFQSCGDQLRYYHPEVHNSSLQDYMAFVAS